MRRPVRGFRMHEDAEQNLQRVTEALQQQVIAGRVCRTDALSYALQLAVEAIQRDGRLPPINGGTRGSFKVGGR